MNQPHIGRSLRRLEDDRFLTGQGRYVDDIDMPGQLHGIVLRSPHGHAAIDGIDTAAAVAMPGVRGVFTAADLDADRIGPLPCIAQVATVAPIIVPPRRALARDRVRHVGDPVAFVVADTSEQARDAAERIAVAYRPLPAVVDATAALAAGAPLLWTKRPAICPTGSSAATNRRSRRHSLRPPMWSRSSWSTTGWSSLRSSRAPRSDITMPPPTASNCC
jgi:carbon-monoxide dehydrogenase large subunit